MRLGLYYSLERSGKNELLALIVMKSLRLWGNSRSDDDDDDDDVVVVRIGGEMMLGPLKIKFEVDVGRDSKAFWDGESMFDEFVKSDMRSGWMLPVFT